VFDVPISQYSVEKIISMMLEPCAKSLICSERPTDIHSSATFVIDLEKLQHPDDAKRDNFGKWNPSGSHTVPFKAWYNEEGDVELERLPSHTSGPDVQYLHRMHLHPSIRFSLQKNAGLHYRFVDVMQNFLCLYVFILWQLVNTFQSLVP